MSGKLRVLLLLAMGTWFSASAVIPSLSSAWNLTDAGQAWLFWAI